MGTSDANLVLVSETEYGDADGNITYDKQTYDNLDRTIISERFLLTENPGSALPTGQERIAVLQNNLQDDILLARTEQLYDTRGRVWKTEQSVVNPANGNVQGKLQSQYWYDAAGRMVKQIEPGANHHTKHVYDSRGRVLQSFVKIADTVYSQSESVYDNLGNVLLSTHIERLSTATGTGALTLATGRYQSTAMWYDGFGRSIASANYGTNGGVALTRPATVPVRSDDVLVTETKYDLTTGRAYSSIDPSGKDHRTFVDALGRTVKTVANYTGSGVVSALTPDENVTVEMTYHPSGQVLTLTAKNPTTGDQVTTYEYDGLGRLFQEIYPDAQAPVEYSYNRLGEVLTKTDQNGTIHAYEYDNLGRLLHDKITTLATGVDGLVLKISTMYNVVGHVESVTSYDVADNIVNEVKYEYDTNGLLAKEYQNPSGAVSGASLYVGYTYDTIANGLRTIGMTYPSGKTLSYDYDTIGNITAIKGGGTPLVSYQYSGRSVAQTTYNQPGLTLDLASGLDRFGRIVDHAWKKNSTDVVRIQHGYDRVGNRTYRNDLVHTNNSETYTYDGVNQIKSLSRTGLAESWNYDATGNWLSCNKNGTPENRTHNKVNEIQTSCNHDKNGNMTMMPGMTCKYDAWNRLVEVGNNIRYDYNGLNQRVKKTVAGVTTTSFFNSQWQELESAISGMTTSYLWGIRYIDDLILRERNEGRLYSLADANWNVVATTDALGMVQERMRYDAFGNVTWLDSAFAVKANSDYGWNRTFTGQVLDAETGLMLYRNRYYHTGLGRFITRDPIGYAAGDVSLYRYVENDSINLSDILGFGPNDSPKSKYGCCEKFDRVYNVFPIPEIQATIGLSEAAKAHECALYLSKNAWIVQLWSNAASTVVGVAAGVTTTAAVTAAGGTITVGGVAVGANPAGVIVGAGVAGAGVGIQQYTYWDARAICNSFICAGSVGMPTCTCEKGGWWGYNWTCVCREGTDIFKKSSSERYASNPGGGGTTITIGQQW